MKRKLFSTLLCTFALLLLMGAGVQPDTCAALVPEEESAAVIREDLALDAGSQSGEQTNAKVRSDNRLGVRQPNYVGPAIKSLTDEESEKQQNDSETKPVGDEIKPAETKSAEQKPETEAVRKEEPVKETVNQPELDQGFLIDGKPVPKDTARSFVNGVTYVAMGPTVRALCPQAQVSFDRASKTAAVQAPGLKLTATVGQLYAVANGRYLYAQDGITMKGDSVMIPLRILTEAFGATHTWDRATDTVRVTRGSGALTPAEVFYNQDDLFWLSRIIYAESGNQPLKGKMAVGNVVMNRVMSPMFPNSVHGVLAQRNQFSTYRGGRLANRTPNEQSVIAAKLVLDGGVVEETRGALYFDSLTKSWASGHRVRLTKIGGHTFYR